MDEMLIRAILKAMVMPPLGNILGVVFALLFLRRHPVLKTLLISFSLLTLLLLSVPMVSYTLGKQLERYPALDWQSIKDEDYQAIVVLGSGRYRAAPEYGGQDTAKPMGLVRLRYGAYLHRKTGLPLLVTGGAWLDDFVPEAEFMARVLEEEFLVKATWQEPRSRTTWENAKYSRELTGSDGVQKILLVTHAWHMPRALYSFERAGFDVTAAPTQFKTSNPAGGLVGDYIPNVSSLQDSTWMLHEMLGLLWYRMTAD
ncbi:Putative membrane protein [gamma proteobacterium IMCC2047]|nr:Putative membrane protein [gamma proteobacterium IMCC2047]